MNRNMKRTFGLGLLIALLASTALAGSASAAPAWKFEGKSLEGTETIMGGAFESSMTIAGLVTKCENFLYKVNIKNEGGTGKGEVTEVPLYNCSTNSKACTVTSIGAEALPWPARLTTVGASNYIVIEKVKVQILYGGTKCVLKETVVTVTGTAGGIVDNVAETATFNPTTFSATKTQLEAIGNPIEWLGVFPTEAFEWHRNEALTVS